MSGTAKSPMNSAPWSALGSASTAVAAPLLHGSESNKATPPAQGTMVTQSAAADENDSFDQDDEDDELDDFIASDDLDDSNTGLTETASTLNIGEATIAGSAKPSQPSTTSTNAPDPPTTMQGSSSATVGPIHHVFGGMPQAAPVGTEANVTAFPPTAYKLSTPGDILNSLPPPGDSQSPTSGANPPTPPTALQGNTPIPPLPAGLPALFSQLMNEMAVASGADSTGLLPMPYTFAWGNFPSAMPPPGGSQPLAAGLQAPTSQPATVGSPFEVTPPPEVQTTLDQLSNQLGGELIALHLPDIPHGVALPDLGFGPPIFSRFDAVAFVGSLEQVELSAIAPEDNKCPHCWLKVRISRCSYWPVLLSLFQLWQVLSGNLYWVKDARNTVCSTPPVQGIC